jgi:fucose 4-O-acetylase-like acetyltransferase
MDAIKTLAMFLVIWGHCILHFASWNKNDDTVFVVINSFHISLFMMVAGFFSSSTLSLGFSSMLLKKTKEIIVPCLLWGILIICLTAYYSHTDMSRMLTDYLECLWFLKSLFLCYFLAFITIRIGTIPAFFVILASMVLTIYKMNVMFPAFMLGVFLKKKDILEKNFKTVHFLWIFLSVFIIMAIFYDGNYFNSPNRIMGIIREPSLNKWMAYLGKTAYRILIGNCGALVVIFFFKHYFSSMEDNTICNVGRETFGIYIIQAVILETILKHHFTYYGNNAVFDYIITPILALIIMALCYTMTRLLGKNVMTREWLLGRFPKK